MEIAQIKDDKKSVLEVLNERPHYFLGQGNHSVKVDGKECRVARNNIKGGIMVWTTNGVFHLYWDKTNEKWF